VNVVDPENFLIDQIPRRYWHLVPKTLRTAYSAALALARQIQFCRSKARKTIVGT
jgi:hypothetical protein